MTTKSYASAVLATNRSLKDLMPKQQAVTTHPRTRTTENFIISYGIACTRKNNETGNYEVLMIKKRATYAFVDFIRGRYDPMKHYDLEFMFSGMTINEKILIRTKDFQTVWMCCYGKEPSKNSDKVLYSKSLKKFNQLCEHRGGEFLLDLLNRSTNSDLLWEIPKGRIGKNESPLDSAIREFEEETGINKSMYQLLFDEGTVEYTFADGGVKYKYIYYMALLNSMQPLRYDFRNEHMLVEVAELKFLPANAVFEFNNNRLYKTIRIIIKKLKKYF